MYLGSCNSSVQTAIIFHITQNRILSPYGDLWSGNRKMWVNKFFSVELGMKWERGNKDIEELCMQSAWHIPLTSQFMPKNWN